MFGVATVVYVDQVTNGDEKEMKKSKLFVFRTIKNDTPDTGVKAFCF
jgi:hypothetical protein